MLKVNQYENIEQIMLGREINGTVLYWVAAYYIDGLLIDTGCRYTKDELADYLKDREIRTVVNTHFHEDHIGGNRRLQADHGVDIYAHPDSIDLIRKKPSLYPYQEMVWGYPEPSETKPVPNRISTPHHTFECIETPGHSTGHVVLFEREKGWCFSGDLFVSEDQKVLRADENINGILNSLRMLQALDSKRLILLTSLGGIFEDGRRSIDHFLTRMTDLHEQVRAFHRRGLSAEEIREQIFGRESRLAELTDGHYSICNLIRSLQAGQ